jgi:hypothetical protein
MGTAKENLASAAQIADALGYLSLQLALIHIAKSIIDSLCSMATLAEFSGRTWKTVRRSRSISGYRGDENANMNFYST